MSNLKKIAALSLASSLVLGTVASATASTFTDADDIVTEDAVNTLVTLGVINGNPDGSFNPTGTVTRAEMAKMIYIIKNGGNDNSASFAGLSTFSDTQGHWAEGYIAYCEAQGIIAGKSETIFDPDAPVTGIEALKMALVMLGYNAETEGLVGTTYITKTLALAGDLTGDYEQSFTDDAQRQYAAQMLYNALDIYTIAYDDGVAYDTDYTLGEKALNLGTAYVDVLVSAGEDDKVKDAYDDDDDSVTLYLESDFTKFLGQKVEIKYDTKSGDIYGMESDYDSMEVAYNRDEFDEDDTDELEFDDIVVDLASDDYTVIVINPTDEDNLMVIYDQDDDEVNSFDAIYDLFLEEEKYGSTMTVYENDDDTYGIVIENYLIREVTSVSSDDKINAGGYYYYDDEQISDDVTKGDYVVISADLFYENRVIETIELLEGEVDAKDDIDVKVDGVWVMLLDDDEDEVEAGDEIEYVLFNDMIHYLDVTSSSASFDDYLVVKEVADYDSRYDETYVKVIFADGTESTIVVEELNLYEDGEYVDYDDDDLEDDSALIQPGLYAWEVDSSDNYTLTIVSSDDDDEDFEEIDEFTDDDELNGYTIADDAIIFVVYENGDDFEVITGEELIDGEYDGFELETGNGFISMAVLDDDNGIDYVTVALIDLGDEDSVSTGSSDVYAYVTDDGYSTKNDDGDVIWTFEIFDGTDTYWVETDDSTSDRNAASALSDRDIIIFDLDSDGLTLDDFEEVGETSDSTPDDDEFAYYAVTGYNGDDVIVLVSYSSDIDSAKYEIDEDDTTILYVDSDNKDGYDEGSIEIAEDDDDVYTENAMAIIDSDGLVLLLVIDINGGMDGGLDCYGDEIDY